MSAQLAVIGAGQLGRRHLEALALLSGSARVWVLDPNPQSLALAEKAWADAKPGPALSADFSGRLPERLDAAIVATDAASREKAVEGLLAGRALRYLVLEKTLFQEPEALDRVGARLEAAGVKTWVNCPRRLWPQYRERRVQGALRLRVTGAGWGLATNAVHFLDLAAHLTGFLDFAVDASGLSREAAPSARPGFVEFHGTLVARGGGHEVVLTSDAGPKSRRVEIGGEAVDEASSPPQSRLTHGVVEELLTRGTCGLAPYADSARVHRPLLTAMREHWRAIKGGRETACPLT